MVDPGASDHPAALPSWEEFREDYIADGIPRLYVVRVAPAIQVFVDMGAGRIGIRFEIAANGLAGSLNPHAEIIVSDVIQNGRRYLEISTNRRSLYANFYNLIAATADAVMQGADPAAAFRQAIAEWEALLGRREILSEERQGGLFGELWLLRRLLAAGVAYALDAWTGPTNHAHDFRLEDIELEVKTTSGRTRIHTINGLNQLEPSPGGRLFILSLQVTDGGSAGVSLAEAVTSVRELLPPTSWARLEQYLESYGYRTVDAPYYPRRRKLRSVPILVPVQDGCPRLTPSALADVPSEFAPERIRGVTYQIELTGLGHLDGTPAFLEIVPEPMAEESNENV